MDAVKPGLQAGIPIPVVLRTLSHISCAMGPVSLGTGTIVKKAGVDVVAVDSR